MPFIQWVMATHNIMQDINGLAIILKGIEKPHFSKQQSIH